MSCPTARQSRNRLASSTAPPSRFAILRAWFKLRTGKISAKEVIPSANRDLETDRSPGLWRSIARRALENALLLIRRLPPLGGSSCALDRSSSASDKCVVMPCLCLPDRSIRPKLSWASDYLQLNSSITPKHRQKPIVGAHRDPGTPHASFLKIVADSCGDASHLLAALAA